MKNDIVFFFRAVYCRIRPDAFNRTGEACNLIMMMFFCFPEAVTLPFIEKASSRDGRLSKVLTGQKFRFADMQGNKTTDFSVSANPRREKHHAADGAKNNSQPASSKRLR